MASWFTRALDKITPWDRSGEIERRKKREEERQISFGNNQNQSSAPTLRVAPTQQQSQNLRVQPTANQPEPQRPQNIFAELNNSLTLNRPNNVKNITRDALNKIPEKPQPGTVVKPQPQLRVQQNRPNQTVVVPRRNTENREPERKGFDLSDTAGEFATGVRDMLVTIPREILRGPVRLWKESDKFTNNLAERITGKDLPNVQPIRPEENRVGKFLFGKEPIGPSTQEGRELVGQFTDNETAKNIGGAGNLLFDLADVFGLGRAVVKSGGKRITKSVAKNVGNQITEAELRNLDRAAEEAFEATVPQTIPVRNNIPINQVEGPAQDVAVRNLTEPKPLVQDVAGGQQFATPDAEIRANRERALRAAADEINKSTTPSVRESQRFQGITPRSPEAPFTLDPEIITSAQGRLIDDYAAQLRELGEGNGTFLVPDGEGGYFRASNNVRNPDTKGKRMTKAAWRDEAERQLRNGQAEPGIQQAFNDLEDPEIQAMLTKGERPDAPKGEPIVVKQSNTIPVKDLDETVVPTDAGPVGEVRATAQRSPVQEKSEVVARAPVTKTPAPLPAETEAILAEPRKFTKQQVSAARNQRKLARQLAKTQEQTSEAIQRINDADPAKQSREGFVPTGEFKKGRNKNVYEKTSKDAEMAQGVQETSQMSPGRVIEEARDNKAKSGVYTPRDVRNVEALIEERRVPRGSPEYVEMQKILKESGTDWGKTGALRQGTTMRRNATVNELVSRYETKIYKLAKDPSKIDSRLFDEIEQAEELFVRNRDDAMAKYNEFTKNPTSANAKAYHAAQDAADAADIAARQKEFEVAQKALKGNKDVAQVRELEKMAQAADMYQMDHVDASMLSGTGTFTRNLINAGVSGVEEGLFGRPAAWLARKGTGETVGGGIMGRGSVSGIRKGASNLVDASKARAGAAGKNPLEHIKNWATTGNQIGDVVLDAQAAKNTLNHYREMLRKQGYSGRELTDRASVMARQDPDKIGQAYAQVARTAAGLGKGVTRNNRFETFMKNLISDTISAGSPNGFTEGLAKLITRTTVGFPTAIARSGVEGVKRFTLGAPTFYKAFRTADPQMRALYIKEGLKQAGTGAAVIPPLFYALGQTGAITGGYPDSEEERARWEREGITENSVKIGDAYYQLPAYLGAWAVPGLFYASLGRNEGDFGKAAAETAKIVPDLFPVDMPISDLKDVLEGKRDWAEFLSRQGASAVRATTPAGALLNQLAKSFDPTKNDTTGGTALENFVNRVAGGIPGVNNAANIPNKLDDAGNPIQNPGPVQLAFGAASASQDKGLERSQEIQGEVDDSLKRMTEIGAVGDPNLREILDDEDKLLYDKAASGELSRDELQGLQESLVKGVSQEGTDTAYLEREQYDTHLAALQLKKQLMEADKTVKPSSLKNIDTAITRGQIYKENEIPYELIADYQDIGVEDWRKMGIPPGDDDYDPDLYNPDMYEQLWQIDQLMTEKGVSYKKGALDKNKYYLKESKSGKGKGSGRRSLGSDFGRLKEGSFSPQVQAYETIDQQAGVIPFIRRERPNIVHKISVSR